MIIQKIIISPKIKDNKCYISIKDFGKGIRKEIQTKIFNRFFYDNNDKRLFSSGLGLYFCKLAIESQGGNIKVISEIGKGTEFIFDLPIEKTQKNSNFEKNIENKEEKDFFGNFTEIEILEIKKNSQLFNNVKSYDFTALYEQLNKIKLKNKNVNLWKNELKNAIDYNNY